VASASYEARRFGVRSAMPTVVARRMCPELIVLPGRFDRYEVYSRKFHDVIRDLTPDFEPLGLDEVFADLRSLRLLNVRPVAAAEALRQRINTELGLECGVGLGRNKLFAKLASKKSKPASSRANWCRGWRRVGEPSSRDAVAERAARARPLGRGPATAAKLEKLGCPGSATSSRLTRRRSPATWDHPWRPRSGPSPTARTIATSWWIGPSSRLVMSRRSCARAKACRNS